MHSLLAHTCIVISSGFSPALEALASDVGSTCVMLMSAYGSVVKPSSDVAAVNVGKNDLDK